MNEKEHKDRIYRWVRQRVEEHARHEDGPLPGLCLYWAYYGLRALRVRGIPACLQAGDLDWLRVSRQHYDEHPEDHATHWAYHWSPQHPLSRQAVAEGNLPEIHIWLGIVSTQELVDFSTGMLPEVCRRVSGWDWPGEKPPAYLWTPVNQVPDLVRYRLDADATIYAGQIIARLMKEGKL